MVFRHISECLDGGLMASVKGFEERCQALVGASDNTGADGAYCVQRTCPPEATEGAGARSAPASAAGRIPPKLVVIDGRVAATAKGRPAPAARLSIVTIDGVRVHHAASLLAEGHSRSMDSGVRR